MISEPPSEAQKEAQKELDFNLLKNLLKGTPSVKNQIEWVVDSANLNHHTMQVSIMDSEQTNWHGEDLAMLVANIPKTHQSVLFVVCDKVFASKTQERIQSLVGSLNRSPDYSGGGTIKADIYTITSPEDGEYKIHHGLLTNYENIEANGTISIPDVLDTAKQRWTMAAFAV